MKNSILLSSTLIASAIAAPASLGSLHGRLQNFLAPNVGVQGVDVSKVSFSRSSPGSSSLSSYNAKNNNGLSTAKPITIHFGSTKRHQKLRYLPHQDGDSRLKKRQNGSVDDTSELLNFDDTRYIAPITIAGQDLDVILDTGSTDTFVYSVQPLPLQGVDPAQLPPLFNNDTAVGVVNTDLTYEAQYGSGNGITTTLGAIQLADVVLRGTDFDVTNLTFANLYQSTAATGSSGLLGLGFPVNGVIWLTILDEVYNLTGRVLTRQESDLYFPIVPLLFTERHIPEALFSVEVNRDIVVDDNSGRIGIDFNYTDGGAMTLGAYPEGMSESDFTWSPVPVVEFTQQGQARGLPPSTGNRWTTPLEAVYFNGMRLRNTTLQPSIVDDGGDYFMLIDTGNPSFTLPSDMMSQITNAWACNPSNNVVSCDSAFDLTLQFSGRNFSMSKTDFLVPSGDALDSLGYGGFITTGCQFQAQPNTPTGDELGPGTSITYTAGAPMLRNLITVFDYGDLWNSLETPPRIGLFPRVQ